MKLDINVDENKLSEELTRHAQNAIQAYSKLYLNSLLRTKELHGTEGSLTAEIKAKIELYTQSAEFNEMLQNTIRHFAGEAAQAAIIALMHSRSRKMLFEPTAPDILKELKNE